MDEVTITRFSLFESPQNSTLSDIIFSKFRRGSTTVKALNESEVENLGNFQPLSRSDSKRMEDRSIVTVDH